MTLLETIMKASAEQSPAGAPSKYPIMLNADLILLNLKPVNGDSTDSSPSLVQRVEGWQIAPTDTEIIDSGRKFAKNLRRRLKSPQRLGVAEFIEMLSSYLEEVRVRVGIPIDTDPFDARYTCALIERVGFLMGGEIASLVSEGCIVLELWGVLDTLIVNGLIERSYSSVLIHNLIEKKRSDLICQCVRYVSDLQISDLPAILKYFLIPPEDAYDSMITVRKEWETQALTALADEGRNNFRARIAREATILLMLAHDDFSDSELCLHFVLWSSNFDDVVMSSCFSKLNGEEMKSLIGYLVKWLRKYERFPQAGPLHRASSILGWKLCGWIPSLDDIAKCLGWLLDEHFPSLVLHSEFHDELRSLRELVSSLIVEAKLRGAAANIIDILKTEVRVKTRRQQQPLLLKEGDDF